MIPNRKRTARIVVHCSYTRPSQDIGVKDIRIWHMQRGFIDVGYHFVIRRDGTQEIGRAIEQIGAHAKGYNADSIGICLVGGAAEEDNAPVENYTPEQWEALRLLVRSLLNTYAGQPVEVCGHRDLPGVKKECPCFDVREWYERTFHP